MQWSTKGVNRLYIIQIILIALYLIALLAMQLNSDWNDAVLSFSSTLHHSSQLLLYLLSIAVVFMGVRSAIRHNTKHANVFMAVSFLFALLSWFGSAQIFASYYLMLFVVFLIYLVQGLIIYGHYRVCLDGCPIN